jgi:hypothetical protein
MNSLSVSPRSRRLFACAMLSLAAVQSLTTAFAGPPLICHPYSIGAAKSLPGEGSHWLGISKSYDRRNLVTDTLALLTPTTPILVRMETLRRASIYATSEMRGWGKDAYTDEDRRISAELVKALQDRVAKAQPADRALALFDTGFFAETLRQTNMDPAVDGYALLTEAAKLRGNDPETEFALALASVSPRRQEHDKHLARARAAAKENSLLATNLATHFSKS